MNRQPVLEKLDRLPAFRTSSMIVRDVESTNCFESDLGPRRLVHRRFHRGRNRRLGVDRCACILRATQSPFLGAAGVGVRSGVDGVVHTAGIRRLARLARTRIRRARTALGLFLVQLTLNALWSWLFFVWRQGAAAFGEVLVLEALIVATMVAFWRVRPLAGALLIPYALWVGFASLLTYSVWQRNPDLLG